MYLSDIIEQLQKAEESVGPEAKVYIHIDNQEIELFSISARMIDIDDYEIVLE